MNQNDFHTDYADELAGAVSTPPPVQTPCCGLTTTQHDEITKISLMSHYDLCYLWRNAGAGHPYFDHRLPYHEVFRARLFDHFGGFTPAISKSIGWDGGQA